MDDPGPEYAHPLEPFIILISPRWAMSLRRHRAEAMKSPTAAAFIHNVDQMGGCALGCTVIVAAILVVLLVVMVLVIAVQRLFA
jgi:hypothetical protein